MADGSEARVGELYAAWYGRPVTDPITGRTGICLGVTSDGSLAVRGGRWTAYVAPPEPVAVVRCGGTTRLYALSEIGTARMVSAAAAREFAVAAEYVADGDSLGLRLLSGNEAGRVYMVTLPTCGQCGVGYEPDAETRTAGDLAFCSQACVDEWRWVQP